MHWNWQTDELFRRWLSPRLLVLFQWPSKQKQNYKSQPDVYSWNRQHVFLPVEQYIKTNKQYHYQPIVTIIIIKTYKYHSLHTQSRICRMRTMHFDLLHPLDFLPSSIKISSNYKIKKNILSSRIIYNDSNWFWCRISFAFMSTLT